MWNRIGGCRVVWRNALRFVALGAFFCLATTVLAHAGASETSPWYTNTLVGMEVGPTGAQSGSDRGDIAYASKFSGKDIVDAQITVGSQYLVIWGKDSEYAYYNSKVAPKCPGLGERDVIREAVDAAKRNGLPVIVYCVVQGNGYPLRDHPEYKMKGVDGKPIDRICLNSGFMEHLKQLVDEMLAYGIQGFHVDMLDQGFGPPYGCWCDACLARFEQDYAKPMPTGVSWDEAWDRMLEFRYNTCERFEREIYRYIKEKQPDCSVDFNYHGNPPFSFELGQRPIQHAHIGDFVTGECGVWAFGALSTSLEAEFLRGTDPEKPFQVVLQRGVRMYHDQTTRPLNDMRWEVFSLLMHGAQVTIVDKTPFDGALDRVAYERFGQVYHEVLAKKEHFGTSHKPINEVGIFFSHRTRDWYGRETPRRYFEPFYGAHEALALEHIPMAILFDENLSAERLATFPVVYIPGAAIISDTDADLFRAYVREGGNLILTGDTGIFDQIGAPLGRNVLSDLIGAEFVERLETDDNHVSLPSAAGELEPLGEGIPRDWPFLVRGAASVYRPTTAQPYGTLFKPYRSILQQQGKEGTWLPQSPEKAVGPAMLVNQFGKGRVVCITSAPDTAIAGEWGMVEDRLLIRNAVRFLNPAPRVRIDAPSFVETIITEGPEPKTLRVHFVAYLSTPQSTAKDRPLTVPGLIEDQPIYRARIEVADAVERVQAFNQSTAVKHSDSVVSVQIEDIHDVIEIRLR